MKEKMHKCEKCGHVFTFAWNLKQHLKHSKYCGTSEEEFKCTNCGKKFTLGSTLKHHFARCIAVDPHRFACQHCPRMFTFKSSLRKHLRGRCPNLSYDPTNQIRSFEMPSFKSIEVVHIDEIHAIDSTKKVFKESDAKKEKYLLQNSEKVDYISCGLQDENIEEDLVYTDIQNDNLDLRVDSDNGLKFIYQDDNDHNLDFVQH